MILIMLMNFSVISTIQCFAHDAKLNVNYDNCEMDPEGDGINEAWYTLTSGIAQYHYPDEKSTIKYYFESSSSDGYTWTTDVSPDIAQEIKDAFANSMKKWNDVYFYSYDNSGTIVKQKIINIVEGTAEDHNLSIYPKKDNGSVATTTAVGGMSIIESGHYHYTEWEMEVSIKYFYVHDNYTASYVNTVRERNGAHEFGHVLGVFDLDSGNLCRSNNPEDTRHHHEILMGYGSPMSARSVDIKYKDIAGVAITRGFHTDKNHIWLNCGRQSDLRFKLICSVCNAVTTLGSIVTSLYDTYGACNNAHDLSSGNMMAVASYGTRDYYKCKYCRYVAPFSSIVRQNYSKTDYSEKKHKCVNTVRGLSYTFYEGHRVTSHVPSGSDIYHNGVCGGCGHFTPSKHIVTATAGKFATCLICGATVRVGNGTISPSGGNGETVTSISDIGGRYITDNGSYILPSGVIVLVKEDVEAYLKGELVLPDDLSWSSDEYE